MKKLFAKQPILEETDHYPIFDEEGRDIYFVDQDAKWHGNLVHVCDGVRTRLFSIHREPVSFFTHYRINFADGRVAKVNSRITGFKKSFDLQIKPKKLSVKGDFISRNFNIFRGEDLIGSVEKDLVGQGDVYGISVYNEAYQDLIVAITVTVDLALKRVRGRQ